MIMEAMTEVLGPRDIFTAEGFQVTSRSASVQSNLFSLCCDLWLHPESAIDAEHFAIDVLVLHNVLH